MTFAFFCCAELCGCKNTQWEQLGGCGGEEVIITHHLAANPTFKSGLRLIPWLARFRVQATDEKADKWRVWGGGK